MNIKRQLGTYIAAALLVLPLFSLIVNTQPASAYKCSGGSSEVQYYYKDGACYQPVGTACLDNPAPANLADCKNRDTSRDTKVTDQKPVKNDGTEVAEWECGSGTYNATKHVCETCTTFGGCTTNTRVTPTPKGNDDTKDPDTVNPEDDKTKTANGGGKGECAGEKTDLFACDAEGGDAIIAVLKIVVLIMSVGVGIVAVGGLVYGAILYASAQDSQDQIRKSIGIVRGVIAGLVLYIFMVAIINFLVPGGVFGPSEPPAEEQQQAQPEEEQNTQQNNSGTTNGN